MDWKQYLRSRTRSPEFLWRLVLGILTAGFTLGFLVQWIPVQSPSSHIDRLRLSHLQNRPESSLASLDDLLGDRSVPFEELIDALVVLQRRAPKPKPDEMLPQPTWQAIDVEEVQRRLNASPLSSDERSVASGFWQSVIAKKLTDELTELAAREPRVRYANHAVGVFWDVQESVYQAAKAFEREGQFPDAKESRMRAIWTYIDSDDFDNLSRLAADDVYAAEIPAMARLKMAAEARDWWTYWWWVPRNEWERFKLGPSLLALLTGICWFVFALQAGQVGTSRGARWWPCVAAVVLGALSIWPTHLLISWQEKVWRIEESEKLVDGIRFFVVGVGLREEFSKLLLLTPLLPFLVRRGNELEALIVSACVGLGFATVENAHYFTGSFGSDSVGRFLTANFFHMAATGLIGLAVVRGIQQPRTRLAEALLVFGVIMFAHGIYDAAIVLPDLQEYAIVPSVIYILLAYQFFHELREMRIERQDTISLTATFLAGVSLVAAATFVYISSFLGCNLAVRLLVPEALSMVLMVIMFLREMPASLVSR